MVDQTAKQLALAARLRSAAVAMDDLAAEVAQLTAEFPLAGTMEDAIFVDTTMAHMDANDAASLVTRFGDFTTWLNADFRRDILRKVR